MAKGNPFLGTVSGSFGDLTLKNVRGKLVLSRKSTKPHNPRTSKQIYQRMFFATVAKARVALKNIVDHSFENIPHGIDSLSYFQKRNIAVLRDNAVYDYAKQAWISPNMNFVAPKSNVMAPNPFRISEGSLGVLTPSNILIANPSSWSSSDETMYKRCVPLWGRVVSNTETQDELFHHLLDQIDIFVGDYLTLVMLTKKVDDVAPYACKVKFVRYKVCVNRRSTGEEDPLYEEQIAAVPSNINGVNYEIPDVVIDFDFPGLIQNDNKTQTMEYGKWTPYVNFEDPDTFECSIEYPGGAIEIHGGNLIPESEELVACAWIHSRPDDDNILASTQDLILADPTGERIPFSLGLEAAFDLWTKQGKAIGDARYLLEGGDV